MRSRFREDGQVAGAEGRGDRRSEAVAVRVGVVDEQAVPSAAVQGPSGRHSAGGSSSVASGTVDADAVRRHRDLDPPGPGQAYASPASAGAVRRSGWCQARLRVGAACTAAAAAAGHEPGGTAASVQERCSEARR